MLQSFPGIMDAIKDQFNSAFFMNGVILLCWVISTTRNDRIFRGMHQDVQAPKELLLRELSLVSLRVKPSLVSLFDQWLQYLL
jgi:hypothetical protein